MNAAFVNATPNLTLEDNIAKTVSVSFCQDSKSFIRISAQVLCVHDAPTCLKSQDTSVVSPSETCKSHALVIQITSIHIHRTKFTSLGLTPPWLMYTEKVTIRKIVQSLICRFQIVLELADDMVEHVTFINL